MVHAMHTTCTVVARPNIVRTRAAGLLLYEHCAHNVMSKPRYQNLAKSQTFDQSFSIRQVTFGILPNITGFNIHTTRHPSNGNFRSLPETKPLMSQSHETVENTATARPAVHQITTVWPCLPLLSVGARVWCPLPSYMRAGQTEAGKEMVRAGTPVNYEAYTFGQQPWDFQETPFTHWRSKSNLRRSINQFASFAGKTRLEAVGWLTSTSSDGILDNVVIRVRQSTQLQATGAMFEKVCDLTLAEWSLEGLQGINMPENPTADWFHMLDMQIWGKTLQVYLQVCARLHHQLGHLATTFPMGALPSEGKMYLASDAVKSVPVAELQDRECPICLFELAEASEDGGAIPAFKRIPCSERGHVFHSDCISEWLSNAATSNRSCPLCRQVLFKELHSRPYAELTSPELREVFGIVGPSPRLAWSIGTSKRACDKYFSIQTNRQGAPRLLQHSVSDPFQTIFSTLAQSYLGGTPQSRDLRSWDHCYSRTYRRMIQSIREVCGRKSEQNQPDPTQDTLEAILDAIRSLTDTAGSLSTEVHCDHLYRRHRIHYGEPEEGYFPPNTLLANKKDEYYDYVLEQFPYELDVMIEGSLANKCASVFPADLFNKGGVMELLFYMEVKDGNVDNLFSANYEASDGIDAAALARCTPVQQFIIETHFQVQKSRNAEYESSCERAWDQYLWDVLTISRVNSPSNSLFAPPTGSLADVEREDYQEDPRPTPDRQLAISFAESHKRLPLLSTGLSLQRGLDDMAPDGVRPGVHRLDDRSTLFDHPMYKLSQTSSSPQDVPQDQEMLDAD